jgi:hypothetical protein
MTKYTVIENPIGGDCIQRDNENGSISYIPIDPANSDYQEYLKNLDEATTL